jgi:hypothetical protein
MAAPQNLHITAIMRGMLSALVVLIPGASHNVFKSNEAHVFRLTKDFIVKLPYLSRNSPPP